MENKKMLLFSDCHFDYCEDNTEQEISRFTQKLKNFVEDNNVDYVCCAGDISYHLEDIETFFSCIEGIKSEVIFVPGNHDISINISFHGKNTRFSDVSDYIPEDKYLPIIDTYERYFYIKNLAENSNIFFLHDTPFLIPISGNDSENQEFIGIIGNAGMHNYDYPHLNGRSRQFLDHYLLKCERYMSILHKLMTENRELKKEIEELKGINSQSEEDREFSIDDDEFFEEAAKYIEKQKIENQEQTFKPNIICEPRNSLNHFFNSLIQLQVEKLRSQNIKEIYFLSHYIPDPQIIDIYYPEDYDEYLLKNWSKDKLWCNYSMGEIRNEFNLGLLMYGHTHRYKERVNNDLLVSLCNPMYNKKNSNSCFTEDRYEKLLEQGLFYISN